MGRGAESEERQKRTSWDEVGTYVARVEGAGAGRGALGVGGRHDRRGLPGLPSAVAMVTA